jgi:hypothetical protein
MNLLLAGEFEMFFGLLALGIVAYSAYSLRQDAQTRETTYTQPLKTIPGNANSLVSEMIDVAVAEAEEKGSPLSDGDVAELRLELMKLMSVGAVEQRNVEMRMTREQISYLGAFLSWFMKQKGLTYEQLEDKYEKLFPQSEIDKYEEIIKSASRANPNVFEKFVSKVTGVASH